MHYIAIHLYNCFCILRGCVYSCLVKLRDKNVLYNGTEKVLLQSSTRWTVLQGNTVRNAMCVYHVVSTAENCLSPETFISTQFLWCSCLLFADTHCFLQQHVHVCSIFYTHVLQDIFELFPLVSKCCQVLDATYDTTSQEYSQQPSWTSHFEEHPSCLSGPGP